ncbi:MAG: hypothetical protein ISS36_02970 [Candidatus Aenigmarchaeota archaeon]|nr:hypothetical protein [Candidatus Aenigmarchaeota archaeon]
MRKTFAVFTLIVLTILLSPGVLADHVGCEIDVYGLTVWDSEISANIKNTGTHDGQIIDYTIYVDDVEVGSGNITLDSGEVKRVSMEYPFSRERYDVGIAVESSCGAWDSEVMIHYILEGYSCKNPLGREGETRCDSSTQSFLQCLGGRWESIAKGDGDYCYLCDACGDGVRNCGETPDNCPVDCRKSPDCKIFKGFLMNYRCEGNILQREFQDGCGSTNWVSIKECENGCEAGLCLSGRDADDEDDEDDERCGIDIKRVDYDTYVTKGEDNRIVVTLENMVSEREDVDVYFYVDGKKEDIRSFSLDGKSGTVLTFIYSLSAEGLHNLKISAIASRGMCSEGDFTTLNIKSRKPVEFPTEILDVINFTMPDPEPEPKPKPWAKETAVMIYPSEIDSNMYDGDVMRIEITSKIPQKFYIRMSGVPNGWIDYPTEVNVDETKTVYAYVKSREYGKYTIHVNVIAYKEAKSFESYIPLFVLKAEERECTDCHSRFSFGMSFELLVSYIIIIFIIIILAARIMIGMEAKEFTPIPPIREKDY